MSAQKKLLAGLVGLLLTHTAFATNGYFSHGYGVKAQGIGGIGIALPQDGLAAATNPAGIAFVGDRADLGLTWFVPKRDAVVTGGPNPGSFDGNDKQNFFIPEFGYTKRLNATTTVGLAVYANGGLNTDYKKNPFGGFLGGSNPGGVNLEQLFITPSVAWQPTADQSLGAGVNFAYQRFEAKGLQGFAGFSSDGNHLTNQGVDTSTGWGLHLGWTGKISQDLTLGATWSSKINASKFSKYKGLFADGGSFDIPESYGVGLAYRATSALTLAADVQEIKYGDVKAVANSVDLLGTTLLGSSNGPGFGWRNVTVYKIGAQYEYSKDLTLRVGYSHTDQPIPAKETLFNILAPATIQDHLTLGATWQVPSGGELSLAYTHAFKKTVNGANSLAKLGGGGEANITLEENALGVAYGWKF